MLRADVVTLDTMEEEASRFGAAVGLDSVSTFECIVDTDSHFFMEMNTRIQVEHRVSELCYALKFSNPDSSGEVSLSIHWLRRWFCWPRTDPSCRRQSVCCATMTALKHG